VSDPAESIPEFHAGSRSPGIDQLPIAQQEGERHIKEPGRRLVVQPLDHHVSTLE
jgi:hypothetical protein